MRLGRLGCFLTILPPHNVGRSYIFKSLTTNTTAIFGDKMVEITLKGNTAQFSDGEWESKDSILLGLCNLLTLGHPWNPVPSNPSPDLDLATFVADKIGAKITHYDKPQYVDGRVY